jgi:alpha-acetolactate decarboxylase
MPLLSFVMMSYLDADKVVIIQRGANAIDLEKQLDKQLSFRNVFYALGVDGSFDYVKTRGAFPGSPSPHPRP